MKISLPITQAVLFFNAFMLLVFNLGNATAFNHLSDDVTATSDETQSFPLTETPTFPSTETPTSIDISTPTFTESLTAFPSPFTELVITSSPVNDETLSGKFTPNEVVVRFRGNATHEAIAHCIQSGNAVIRSNIEILNTLVLSIPENKVADSITRFQACPEVRYAEPNYLVEIADVIPSDPGWANQYGLTNIRAPQGWELSTGSASITIAILDTGIDLNHPDLAGKIVGGTDIFNADNNPQDDNGHGTHVAGIAAATSNNGVGVAGVSWGAQLMPVKVLSASGTGSYADVASGIIWAVDHGAKVINLSLGGNNPSQTLQTAVDYAASRGVILVAASGNSGSNSVLYPARYPNVIAVAATDSSNTRAWFSNYGPEVDLSAPGVSIYSTSLGGYSIRNGTSMATPYVAGLAAILRGISGNNSRSAITQQMQNTALDLGITGWDDFYGHGLIQMDAALQLALNQPTTTAPPSNLPSATLPPSILLPTLTETPLPTQTEIATVSPTLISTSASPLTITPTWTSEVAAQETSQPEIENRNPNWLVPCFGFFFILLGVLLLVFATRKRRV